MNDYIVDAFTKDGENTNLEVNNLQVGCITSKGQNFELDSSGNLTVKSLTANEIAITSQSILFLSHRYPPNQPILFHIYTVKYGGILL